MNDYPKVTVRDSAAMSDHFIDWAEVAEAAPGDAVMCDLDDGDYLLVPDDGQHLIIRRDEITSIAKRAAGLYADLLAINAERYLLAVQEGTDDE